MRKINNILFFMFLFFCNPDRNFAQNNSITLDGAYLVIEGGTTARNIYIVVDQSSTLGIVRTASGGHISSEGQYNFVKWNSGASTGNYIFPFGVGGTASDYIPFTFNKTTPGNSDISMSTWTSTLQNIPWAGASNVAAVANMNITGTIDLSVPSVIDRWWDIQSAAPVTADLTFSYRGIENTTVAPADTFKAQHWNGASWDPRAGPGNPGVTTGIGTVGPISWQTTFSPWVLTRTNIDVPCGTIYIPNAFSPNNDGENDFLQMYYGNIKCIETFKLVIYNRWGEKVFETTDAAKQWDGSFGGKVEGTAVFVYYMKATLISDEEIIRKGNISLIR